ncbi:MAG: hypothetical protein Q7S74_06560 [Nanoarchaeota archaeon]|nr:hypothetical protein [Nanoarchaeota archaeon]
MIVKDSMVIIHLAKITLLESSCELFKHVIIPNKVYNEIMKGKEKGYGEVSLIEALIENHKILVKSIERKDLLDKVVDFNIQGGEAEAVALYWQENADYLATDDDNIRKKKELLRLNLIGTPAILLLLYKKKIIKKEKCLDAIHKLKKIGWFSSTIIDKMIMEVKNG